MDRLEGHRMVGWMDRLEGHRMVGWMGRLEGHRMVGWMDHLEGHRMVDWMGRLEGHRMVVDGPLGGPDGELEGGPLGGPDGGLEGGPLGGPDGPGVVFWKLLALQLVPPLKHLLRWVLGQGPRLDRPQVLRLVSGSAADLTTNSSSSGATCNPPTSPNAASSMLPTCANFSCSRVCSTEVFFLAMDNSPFGPHGAA